MSGRVLLVDDNVLDRDMLSRRLARRGFDVRQAVDGAQALDMVQRDRPDLILLDTSLPVVDGLTVTRQLKADPDTRRVPVLVLTAHAMRADRERAFAAGCDDFDTKPVDLARLLGKMDALLARGLPAVTHELRLSPLTVHRLSEIRGFLAMALTELGGADAVDALVLAVDEVCTNLVEHAGASALAGPTRIAVRREGPNAILTVDDRGAPFDPGDAPAPALGVDWQERAVGGLGWFLVRQMVDDIQYESSADAEGAFNRLTLVKRIAAPPHPPVPLT